MRVGFIGSAHSVARLAGTEALLPGVALRCYAYADPHDTAAQYAAALAENDAVCFSGTISHYHRDRALDGETPVLVGRFSDYTLVASLLAATAGSALTIAELSLDMPNPDVPATVAADTGIALDPAQVTDYRWVYESRYSRPVDVDALVAFHETRAASAGAKLAITSVHAVYDRLSAAGYPAMFMVDSLQRDLDLIRTAQQRVSVRRLEGGLLAVITLTSMPPADAPVTALRAQLAARLGRFATPVQHRLASWQRGGLDMFTTTRGALDAELPAILAELGDPAVPGELALGAGVGRHLYEAEDRALQALRRAIADAGTAAYLVDEDARVHSLRNAAEPATDSRHTAPWLVELAARAGMQARSVTRLLGFLATRDFSPFTAGEWAVASQTSPRTAERTVRKLLDAGALAAVGQEQPLDAGRPRTIYALSDELERAARQHRNPLAEGAALPGTGA